MRSRYITINTEFSLFGHQSPCKISHQYEHSSGIRRRGHHCPLCICLHSGTHSLYDQSSFGQVHAIHLITWLGIQVPGRLRSRPLCCVYIFGNAIWKGLHKGGFQWKHDIVLYLDIGSNPVHQAFTKEGHAS